MKRAGLVITVIFALLALGAGFAGATAVLNVTQPAVSHSTQMVSFEVQSGDTTNSVADRLQKQGIIRNALIFRLWARYRHLDKGIEQGIYQLSPGMTMDQIIRVLQQSKPQLVKAAVPDGQRVTQYPADVTNLTNFDAKKFLDIVKTGKLSDGTDLSTKYWYVEPLQKNAAFALEGYLYPDTYVFDASLNSGKGPNEEDLVTAMLDELGQKLCPGTPANPNLYIHDQAQCKAHAATVGDGKVNIFTAMEQAYFTTDDKLALYDTLTVASLTTREILDYKDAPGVATVYHNRFLENQGKTDLGDTGGFMGSDPSAQYARDTDSPPTDGKWWKDLGDSGSKIDPDSPYNTDNTNDASHAGLPPGPIANPTWQVIVDAATPQDPTAFPYFYFVSDKCGKIYYGKNNDDFNNNVIPKMNTGNC